MRAISASPSFSPASPTRTHSPSPNNVLLPSSRAVNQALQFAITPVVAFATFATYRAVSGTLNVASVFYALSLLQLPKLYM
jgi:hypothetical protein